MAAVETILLLGILAAASGILLTRRIRMAVGLYMVVSLLLALEWGLRYGLRPAIAELGVGVVVTGLLFWFSMRKLRERKENQHEE